MDQAKCCKKKTPETGFGSATLVKLFVEGLINFIALSENCVIWEGGDREHSPQAKSAGRT